MDLPSTTLFNNPSLTAGDSFSGAGEPTNNNSLILLQPKRPVGRPKGSKNKRKRTLRLFEPKSLNSTVVNEIPAGEPIDDSHILRPVKRPVGRPRGSKNKHGGSKNKPKTVPPPMEINSPTVIEIPAGANMVESLLQFCHRHQVSVTVLNASGQLNNIIPYHQTKVSIPGPFPILSLSGTVLPTSPPSGAINSTETSFLLVVLLSLPNGAAFSGVVGSNTTAASVVKVVAATTTVLNNMTFENVHDDLAINGDVEITPLLPQNPQFGEFYKPSASGDMNNQIQLYDNQNGEEKDYHQEHDLLNKKSNNNDEFIELMINEDIWRYEENLTPALRIAPHHPALKQIWSN